MLFNCCFILHWHWESTLVFLHFLLIKITFLINLLIIKSNIHYTLFYDVLLLIYLHIQLKLLHQSITEICIAGQAFTYNECISKAQHTEVYYTNIIIFNYVSNCEPYTFKNVHNANQGGLRLRPTSSSIMK